MVFKWFRRVLRGGKNKPKANGHSEILTTSNSHDNKVDVQAAASIDASLDSQKVASAASINSVENGATVTTSISIPVDEVQCRRKVQFTSNVVAPSPKALSKPAKEHQSIAEVESSSSNDDAADCASCNSAPLKSCLKRSETDPTMRGILKHSAAATAGHSRSAPNVWSPATTATASPMRSSNDSEDVYDDAGLRDMVESGSARESILTQQAQQQKLHKQQLHHYINGGGGRRAGAMNHRRTVSNDSGHALGSFLGQAPDSSSYLQQQYSAAYPGVNSPAAAGYYNNQYVDYPAPQQYASAASGGVNGHISVHYFNPQSQQKQYNPSTQRTAGASLAVAAAIASEAAPRHRRLDSLEMQRKRSNRNNRKKMNDKTISAAAMEALASTEDEEEEYAHEASMLELRRAAAVALAENFHETENIEERGSDLNDSAELHDFPYPNHASQKSPDKSGVPRTTTATAAVPELQENPLRRSSSGNLSDDFNQPTRDISVESIHSLNSVNFGTEANSETPEDTSKHSTLGRSTGKNTVPAVDDRSVVPAARVQSDSTDYGEVVSSGYEDDLCSAEDFKEMERLVSEGFSWTQANDMVSLQRRLKRGEEEHEQLLRSELHRNNAAAGGGAPHAHYFQPHHVKSAPRGQHHSAQQQQSGGSSRHHAAPRQHPSGAEVQRPGAYHASGPLEEKYFKIMRAAQVAIPAAASDSIDFSSRSESIDAHGSHAGGYIRPHNDASRAPNYSAGQLGERGMVSAPYTVAPRPVNSQSAPMLQLRANSDQAQIAYSEHKAAALKSYHSEYTLQEAPAAYEPPMATTTSTVSYASGPYGSYESGSSSRDDYQYSAGAAAIPVAQQPYAKGQRLGAYNYPAGYYPPSYPAAAYGPSGQRLPSHRSGSPRGGDRSHRSGSPRAAGSRSHRSGSPRGVAIGRVHQQHPSHAIPHHTSSGGGGGSTRPFSFTRNNEAVQTLLKMNLGVSELDIVYALRMCCNDTEAAANYLVDQAYRARQLY